MEGATRHEEVRKLGDQSEFPSAPKLECRRSQITKLSLLLSRYLLRSIESVPQFTTRFFLLILKIPDNHQHYKTITLAPCRSRSKNSLLFAKRTTITKDARKGSTTRKFIRKSKRISTVLKTRDRLFGALSTIASLSTKFLQDKTRTG